jgi:hypothetical protein
MMKNHRWIATLLGMLLAANAGSAVAIVCVNGVQYYRYVGSGPGCTDATITQAIANAPCKNTIIAITVGSGGENLTIADKPLTLAGSTNGCGVPPTICNANAGCGLTPPSRISLLGDGVHPVVTVTGAANFRFANLEIHGGVNANGFGGGISYSATGTLVLNNVYLHDNSAIHGGGVAFLGGSGTLLTNDSVFQSNTATTATAIVDDARGGGLSVDGDAGHVEATIGINTWFSNNVAKVGGGIHIGGDVHFSMTADATEAFQNFASHDGGGLAIQTLYNGTPQVDIGSPGRNGNPAIHDNLAYGSGGGIAVDSNARLRLFTTNPTRPVTIALNTASNPAGTGTGGGLAVGPDAAGAIVCMNEFYVSHNSAGTAAAALGVAGGVLYINSDADGVCDAAGLAALGATRCAVNTPCNLFTGHLAPLTADGYASIVEISGVSAFHGDRFSISKNSGGDMLFLNGIGTISAAPMYLGNCVIDNNQSFDAGKFLVRIRYGDVRFDSCTIASNTADSDAVFDVPDFRSNDPPPPPGGFTLTRSIVYQPGHHTWHADGLNPPPANADYVLTNDLGTLPAGTHLVTGDPAFLDPAVDLRPHPGQSPAVDFAPAKQSDVYDRSGGARVVNLTALADIYGPRDLGAYELTRPCYRIDSVFCDGLDPDE